MTGFKPRISGVGRDRSTNCAPTTAYCNIFQCDLITISSLVQTNLNLPVVASVTNDLWKILLWQAKAKQDELG